MTDTMADETSRPHATSLSGRLMSRLVPSAFLYWLVTSVFMLLILVPKAKDWIGPDNDDSMRLVEIRDWLGGQGWYDMMQYRLGLEGGTLMHWSRLIDAPVGFLITLFSLFLPVGTAENMAATVWPLLLAFPAFLGLGLAGRRLGGELAGRQTMHVALGLGAIYVFTCSKFRPGALDHHNAQLALTIGIAALLADRGAGRIGHAAAGLAVALAIAIGAETMPYVAVACLCVAIRWIWQGHKFAPAARAFGLALALAISAAFVGTIPPHLYASVTCDNLSLGFYSLSAIGGIGLFGLTYLPALAGFAMRIVAALVFGAVLAVVAVVVAPQCLGSPLANLDPLLVDLWLSAVTEARPITAEIRIEPDAAAGFYLVGMFAMLICIARIRQGRARGAHLLFLALIGVSWAVSLVQVRGALFANLLSIPPFALLIADLRQKVREDQKDIKAALAFVLTTFASVPFFWAFIGVGGNMAIASFGNDVAPAENKDGADACGDSADMAALRAMAPGLVAAPSNNGAEILRFTPQRVLTGPYHRNQAGMLAELHLGMASPADAEEMLKSDGVSIVAFCKGDPQTGYLISMKPDGLYAALAQGKVPDYLSPVHSDGKFQLFTVNASDPK
ncbi:hypothetical protein [Neorhizobium sp. NCHU2750]|uniref:hypothetical protein n=1 Tax=Neorhizobium sp. NCHU2750 TaxID=1825976 RepID=UPI000EB74BAE|nr:membrane protein [Neorhizobium sp. NCHU2750]